MSNIRNVFEHVVRKQQKQILLDINCLTRGLFLCFQLTGGDNRQPGAVLCLSQAFPPRAHPGVPPSACGSSSGSLQHTVFLVVRFKVLVHAARVCHLLAIDLGQELGIVHPLLLVEQNVGRVRVDLVRVQFLTRGKHPGKSPWDKLLRFKHTLHCPKKGIFNWVEHKESRVLSPFFVISLCELLGNSDNFTVMNSNA